MALTPEEKQALKAEAAVLKAACAALRPTINQLATAEAFIRDNKEAQMQFQAKRNRIHEIAILIWDDEN